MKIVVEYLELNEVPSQIDIIEANLISGYKIEIKFNDGKVNLVDFEPFLTKSLHPEIQKYLNKKCFANFKLVDGNLNWDDYDMIFPVADLYEGKV